jgi:hypothetical protein
VVRLREKVPPSFLIEGFAEEMEPLAVIGVPPEAAGVEKRYVVDEVPINVVAFNQYRLATQSPEVEA